MRIGIRKSPHLEAVEAGILACGDVFTSTYDTGADFYLCWGWPQAQQVAIDNGGHYSRIVCVDSHPFALRAGDFSGDRILQLGNWGALATYPSGNAPVLACAPRHNPQGPVLVIGQVYTREQQRLGLVDVWHTGGYDNWVAVHSAMPNAKFRKHPRVWALENDGEIQPTLEADLEGCSCALTWNSTAGVHAKLLGYPATAAEAHGWANMHPERLEFLRASPEALRSGKHWHTYRRWLVLESAA